MFFKKAFDVTSHTFTLGLAPIRASLVHQFVGAGIILPIRSISTKAIIIISLALALGLVSIGTAQARQPLRVGVYLPERSREAISSHEAKVGRHQDIIMYYGAWGYQGGKVDAERIQWILDNGSTPMITWEPWRWDGPGSDQPDYSLKKISSGAHDAYLREYARDIRNINGIVYMRPMHEMNGDWYPWAGTVNGNSPEDFVPAWRRIVDIFRQEGADNVRWVWSPNNSGLPDWTTSSYATYYPGDNYVDFAAIDGYNSGTMHDWSQWELFDDVFRASYNTISNITDKPIIIAETASTELGGDKAAWITNAFDKMIGHYPRITAVVWFNTNKESDWRVDSSPASLAAYKRAMDRLGDGGNTVNPTGSVQINGGQEQTKYENVNLNVQATDSTGTTVAQMSFMNAGGTWTPWEPYQTNKSWALPSNDGTKKVWARFKDKDGREVAASDKIILDTKIPSALVKTPFISAKTARNSRFKVIWSGVDPSLSSGIASYQVQVKRPGGKWRTWRQTSRLASWFSGRQGQIYAFRVRATDKAQNVGVYSSAKKTVVPYDDNRRVRRRKGFKNKVYDRRSGYYKGTVRYSTVAGDKMTYSFKGRAVYFISTKAADRSKARIYIDGKYKRTINTYSENTKYRKVVFRKRWKKNEKHTITIKNVGNRDRLDVDAIAIVK